MKHTWSSVYLCVLPVSGTFLWLAQSRKDLFCVWDQDGELRPSSVLLPPEVKTPVTCLWVWFHRSLFTLMDSVCFVDVLRCSTCVLRWSWLTCLPVVMLCGAWTLMAESVFVRCLLPVLSDSTGPVWTSASLVRTWVIQVIAGWNQTGDHHITFLSLALLSTPIYNKFIQSCGSKPNTARIKQIHQLHQICRTTSSATFRKNGGQLVVTNWTDTNWVEEWMMYFSYL